MAAAAGAGAVLGGVAGYAANGIVDDEPEVEVNEELQDIVEEVSTNNTQSQPASTPSHTNPAPSVQSQVDNHNDDIASSISSGPSVNTTPSSTPSSNSGNTTPSSNGGGENGGGEVVTDDDIEITTEPLDISINDEVDVVIAGNEVDPNDIESIDPIFDEITTVYSVDGEAQTQAYFHTEGSDEEYVMIDLDGDDVFDIIFDNEETPLAYTDLTVGDVEQMMSAEDPEYIAATDNNEFDDTDEIDFTDDLIIT